MNERPGAWRGAVHADRVQALASTDPADVRVQSVDATFWRVVDASASWDDPSMLLGFVERTPTGFDCTLMAALHEHRHVGSLRAAHVFFEDACSVSRFS